MPTSDQFLVLGPLPALIHVLFSAGLDDLTLLNGTNINATVGDDVVIEIGFNANPMPNFTVTYVSTVSADQPNALPVVAPALGVQSVDSRLNISGNILKLSNVTENDTGIYTVEARNLAGNVSADFNLTVRCELIPIAALHNSCVTLVNMYAC